MGFILQPDKNKKMTPQESMEWHRKMSERKNSRARRGSNVSDDPSRLLSQQTSCTTTTELSSPQQSQVSNSQLQTQMGSELTYEQ